MDKIKRVHEAIKNTYVTRQDTNNTARDRQMASHTEKVKESAKLRYDALDKLRQAREDRRKENPIPDSFANFHATSSTSENSKESESTCSIS